MEPSDYFSVDQDMVCFFPEKGFVAITVVDNTSDGIVFTVPQSDNQKQHLRYVHDPKIMGKWEFEYLKQHPKYRALWLKTSEASDKMAAAFAAIE